MKKFIYSLILILTLVGIVNNLNAAGAPGMIQGFNTQTYNPYIDTQTTSPLIFIGNILQTILTLMGAVAVVMIIYAGVLISTSKGDDGIYKKGKKIIGYAVLGLIIIIASWSIVFWVTGANSFLWNPSQSI